MTRLIALAPGGCGRAERTVAALRIAETTAPGSPPHIVCGAADAALLATHGVRAVHVEDDVTRWRQAAVRASADSHESWIDGDLILASAVAPSQRTALWLDDVSAIDHLGWSTRRRWSQFQAIVQRCQVARYAAPLGTIATPERRVWIQDAMPAVGYLNGLSLAERVEGVPEDVEPTSWIVAGGRTEVRQPFQRAKQALETQPDDGRIRSQLGSDTPISHLGAHLRQAQRVAIIGASPGLLSESATWQRPTLVMPLDDPSEKARARWFAERHGHLQVAPNATDQDIQQRWKQVVDLPRVEAPPPLPTQTQQQATLKQAWEALTT